MTLKRYQELMASQKEARVTWSVGQLHVVLPEKAGEPVRIGLEAQLQAVEGSAVEVPLLPTEATLQGDQLDGDEAALYTDAGVQTIILKDQNPHQLSLQYQLNGAQGSERGAYVMVPLPPLPSSHLSIEGKGPLSVWPASQNHSPGNRLNTHLPATPAILIKWGGQGGETMIRSLDYLLRPDAEGLGVDVTAHFDVYSEGATSQIRIAKIDSALIDISEASPEQDQALLSRVEEGWHVVELKGVGRHQVTARFRSSVDRSHGQPQVRLNPNKVPMTRVEISVAGKRALSFEPPVPHTTNHSGEGENLSTRAVAQLPPTEEILIRWTEARAAPETQVRVNTEAWQMITLQEGVIRSKILLDYDVIHGKVKELPIQLPERVVLYKVQGEGIEDWRIFPASEEAPRQVRVILGQELESSLRLELQLETVVATKEGSPLSLPLVRPLQAFREGGVVALFDGDKVGFAPAEVLGNFRKVGEDALPLNIRQGLRDKVSQAFKHVGALGQLKSKVATAKSKEARFDARVDTLYLIKEGSLTGQAVALIEMKSGRREKLVISLPEGVAEPRITAPSLNKVEPLKEKKGAKEMKGRRAYEVRFTQALEGAVQLDIEFELILKKKLGTLKLPDVQVHGAEVETGSLGIAAEAGMEVKPGLKKILRSIETQALPKAIRLRTDLEIILGYQYAHVPWSLELDIKRHRTVQTLNAEAVQVWITTDILENGHFISEAFYRVRNDDRQFLRLKLPEESKVLKVEANARKVKAVQDEKGAIAIPLAKNAESLIGIRYEQRGDILGIYDKVKLQSPNTDLRCSDIQWRLRISRERALISYDSPLKNIYAYHWRAPSHTQSTVIAGGGNLTDYLFSYPVHDSNEKPLEIELKISATPGEGSNSAFLIFAFLMLAWVTRQRALRKPMNLLSWGALFLGGVLTLLGRSALWSLEVEETGGFILLLLLVALFSHIQRRKREQAELF